MGPRGMAMINLTGVNLSIILSQSQLLGRLPRSVQDATGLATLNAWLFHACMDRTTALLVFSCFSLSSSDCNVRYASDDVRRLNGNRQTAGKLAFPTSRAGP